MATRTKTLEQIFKTFESITKCANNSPVLLNDPDYLYWIETADIDVFAVAIENGEPQGRRLPLFTVETGELLFGTPEQTGLDFLAAGKTQTQIRKIPLNQFLELLHDKTYRKQLIGMIDAWIMKLSSAISQRRLLLSDHLADKIKKLELNEVKQVTVAAGVRWFKTVKGQVSFMYDTLLLDADSPLFLPLTPTTWINSTASEVELTFTTTEKLAEEEKLIDSLYAFHMLTLQCLTIRVHNQTEAEETRFKQRTEDDHHTLINTLNKIASILRPKQKKQPVEGLSNQHLLTASKWIAEAAGIKINFTEEADRNYTLAEIALAANFKTREVQLTPDWWQNNGGPLLVFYTEEKIPCAAIPINQHQYELIEPGQNTKTIIDKNIAKQIKSSAYVFYRPFPNGKLTVKDLLTFAIYGNTGDIIRIILIGLFGGLLGTIVPIFTGTLFDKVIPQAELGQLGQIVLALVTVAFATATFQLTRVFSVIRLSGKMNLNFEAALWDRLIQLPMSFFKQYSTGDLTMRAMGISAIRSALTGTTISAVLGAVFSIFNLFLLFYYAWNLALLAIGLLAIVAIVTVVISRLQIKIQRNLQDISGNLAGKALQMLNGIAKIQSAAREAKAFSLWADQFAEQRQITYKSRILGNILGTFNAVFMPIITVSLFACIAFLLSGFPIGKFIAFNAAYGQFSAAIMSLVGALLTVLQIFPLLERANPIIQELPENSELKADPGKLMGNIEINNINFRYAVDGPVILKDVSLQVKSGEFIALVGKSGSGKSTLFRLLLGFEQAESGSIFYDGKDISQLNIQKIRQQLGVVLQNGSLMADSIFRNIVGSAPLSIDDAWEAARMAGFDEDVQAMPMGMHTVLSEGASTLSGGQRQRLMIARALARRPHILLFDEATSALDNRTQAIVSESLDSLNVTRVVIAHRLSTIINADRIYVVDRGQIIQQGNYKELMEQPGLFAEMAKRQQI